jgi:hypothetical protein
MNRYVARTDVLASLEFGVLLPGLYEESVGTKVVTLFQRKMINHIEDARGKSRQT